MAQDHRVIPVYTTRGSLGALLLYPFLYNPQGEWIGWVTPERDVFSVHGHYVGWITEDPRIVNNRTPADKVHQRTPPKAPSNIRPPATIPLPPMMPELPFNLVDILDERPDLVPTLDAGEMREDMD